jgi:hypothetical protein
MSSAKEFREFARECLDWAQTAKSEHERTTFMQMAQTWIEAAERMELASARKSEPQDSAIADITKRTTATSQEPPDGPQQF